jgi:hypothetical protein
MKAFVIAAALLFFACGQTTGPSASVSVAVQGPGRVLSIPPGIDCPRVCVAAFPVGTTVTFAAVPGDEGAFREWSGDCAAATGCELTVTAGASVVARFDPH